MSDWAWTNVDQITIAERANLVPGDLCFYYMTRDSRGFAASKANGLMNDFKKDPAKYSGRPDVMAHKRAAIEECAGYVSSFFADRSAIFSNFGVSLVPIPTSIPRGDEGRDDRLDTLCSMVADTIPFVTCEKAIDVCSRVRPSHRGGTREVPEIRSNLRWTGSISACEKRGFVVLFDDILTTGAHYAACRDGIIRRYGERGFILIGLFLALHTWPSVPT